MDDFVTPETHERVDGVSFTADCEFKNPQILELSDYLTHPSFGLLKKLIDGLDAAERDSLCLNVKLSDRELHEHQGAIGMIRTLVTGFDTIHKAAEDIRAQSARDAGQKTTS